MATFCDALAHDDGRAKLIELVPWAGSLHDEAGERGRAMAEELATAHLTWLAHVLEQAVAVPMFHRQDCGDGTLPDIASLCRERACARNQRNGPCGGSLNGRCEVPGRPCIWTSAFEHLKPYGEEMTMLERAPVLQENAPRGTSDWADTFLGRDHHAHPSPGGDT